MQITKLILENFSSYENLYEIDFSTDKAKPIILIGGQNGAGKTSIFTAIKLALYGPLAYGYSGINNYYTKKIKSLINTKAFQNEKLISGISVEFCVINVREETRYLMSRYWRTEDEKIVEDYRVYKDGNELNKSDSYYFENYLHTIIPPEMFDFFLFDGEEIGSIFATEGYNKYIKSALLTLCGIDIFSVVQGFCRSYIGKSDDTDPGQEHKYEELIEKIDTIAFQRENAENEITKLQAEKEKLNALIIQREQEFNRAGGIDPVKRSQIEKKNADIDRKRETISQNIKSFVEQQMPFYMLRDFFKPIEEQIDHEEKIDIHDYVKYKVTPKFIEEILSEYTLMSEDASQAVCDEILKRLYPGNGTKKDNLLGLSRDEVGRIEEIINTVEDIDQKELIKSIKTKAALTQKYIKTLKELRESLSEEDAERFRTEIENAKNRLETVDKQTETLTMTQNALSSQLEMLESEREKMYQVIKENAQNKHILELNSGLSEIMEAVIVSKTESLRKKLAELTVKDLQKIYRKNNLVSLMTVNRDFKFELYQNQIFKGNELSSLLNNIGIAEFVKQLGELSVQRLFDEFNVSTNNELKDCIEKASASDKEYDLFKKVELNSLSKGERQIFILALYWAMIQISGKKIPFIIDTPYARIDAKHRKEISKKFFPNISDQVIILSTDEEITEEYYKIINPYISKEYLLNNDKKENKTSISDGYFFKVV